MFPHEKIHLSRNPISHMDSRTSCYFVPTRRTSPSSNPGVSKLGCLSESTEYTFKIQDLEDFRSKSPRMDSGTCMMENLASGTVSLCNGCWFVFEMLIVRSTKDVIGNATHLPPLIRLHLERNTSTETVYGNAPWRKK